MTSVNLKLASAEDRLKETLFVVEATTFEQLCLWQQRGKTLKWEQLGSGWMIQVGNLGTHICNISASWFRIEGQWVMFYYPCSRVSDSEQTDKWLDKHFTGKWDKGHRRARTNAMNFAHCIQAIREANLNIES